MTSLGDLESELVELMVGGVRYTVAVSDLQKHPESFFATILKKEWKPASEEPIKIERDGVLFKFVFAFLVTGHLPRKSDGTIALDAAVVALVKEEADFYNLPNLVTECETNALPSDVFSKVAAHSTIRSCIETMKSMFSYHGSDCAIPTLTLKYDSSDPANLVNVLASAWMPFCMKGCLSEHEYACTRPLFKTSTVSSPQVQELLKQAKQSPFGRGTETVIDTSVRNSFEIAAEHLNANALNSIKHLFHLHDFAPKMKLDVRPYKLVIYQEGGHFDQHRDTVRGDNHIGTLVVILNSAYTGGELEVTHGGKTEVVTGPYQWVAMYGDCLHKINPVTSGTRVSLIYDIYATGATAPGAPAVGADEADDAVEHADASEGSVEDEEDDYEDSDQEGEDGLGEFFSARRNTELLTADNLRGIEEPQRQLICAALDKELDTHGTVVICLAHLYPACQSNPSFLKGGDLALYELLRDKYQVSVEAVSVYMNRDEEDSSETTVVAAMFKDVEHETAKREANEADYDPWAPAAKKPKLAPIEQTLFVIPAHLSHEHVLDYSPYIEHTGNESQAEETVYIVAGLQVRKLK